MNTGARPRAQGSRTRPQTGSGRERQPARRQERPGSPRPRQPYAPSPRPRQTYGRRDRSLLMIAAIGTLVVVLAYFLQLMCPDGFPLTTRNGGTAGAEVTEIHSNSVRINEIVTSNRATAAAQDGSTPDWIEIINVTEQAQNITGYSLAKSENASEVFTFPEMTLQPGECAVVYADSKLRNDPGQELHAPFRISADGDTLLLFNAAGSAIDTVNIPALSADQSYARLDRTTWTQTTVVTCGLANTNANYTLLHTKAEDSPIRITEVMAVNAGTCTDENGVYCDYIELTNTSSDTVDLTGWYLSDDAASLCKWRFAAGSIAPGECLLVYADGRDQSGEGLQPHTSFSLSAEREQVCLSDSTGQLMDSVSWDVLKKDQALSLGSDGTWTQTATPTPGSPN